MFSLLSHKSENSSDSLYKQYNIKYFIIFDHFCSCLYILLLFLVEKILSATVIEGSLASLKKLDVNVVS